MHTYILLLSGIATMTFLSGCKKETPVQVYTTQKEASIAAPTMMPPVASAASTSATLPDLGQATAGIDTPTWTPPGRWVPQPLDNIRKGSWKLTTNDGVLNITAMAFPGDVGGDLANVNRWLGQIGLNLWDNSQFEINAKKIEVDGRASRYFILGEAGASTNAILGAIVPVGPVTWYFKLIGPTTLALAEKAHFEAFLQTIHFPATE